MNNKKHIPLLLGKNNWGRSILSFSLYILLSLSIYAQSSAAFITPNEHDENGTHNSLVRINESNNTYLLAYTGYGGKAGYLKSFTISKDGNTITPLKLNGNVDYNFDSKKAFYNSLVQLNSDIYVLAYTSAGEDGWIKTFKVSADGLTVTKVDEKEHDGDHGEYNSLIKLDNNTVALAYSGQGGTSSKGGWVKTFDINADGSSITEVAKFNYRSNATSYNSLIKVDDNTLAVAYNSYGGFIKTLDISTDGTAISDVKEFKFDSQSNGGISSSFIGGESGKFVLAYMGYDSGTAGYTKTFTITPAGEITHEASLIHAYGNVHQNKMIKVSTDVYALFYRHPSSGQGFVKTLYIPADAKLISEVTNTRYYANNNYYNSPIKIDGDIYANAWAGAGGTNSEKGFIGTFKIRSDLPFFKSVTIAPDNSTLTVTFNEAVYTSAGATTALVKEDFTFSISGGKAKLSGATPTSIAISGNTYTLGIGLIGLANGAETITVNPAATDAIFDANDNKVTMQDYTDGLLSTTTKRNAKPLNDLFLPYITGTHGEMPIGNTTIGIQFNEAVFSNNDGTGALAKEDFALTITGGDATLSSATPSAITDNGSNRYTLTFAVTGRANGSEDLAVTPVANSIYDKAGNIAATTQSNNSQKLTDGRITIKKSNENIYASTSSGFQTVKVGHQQYLTFWLQGSSYARLSRFTIDDDGNTFNKRHEDYLSYSARSVGSLIRGPGHIFISAGQALSYGHSTHGAIIRTHAVPNGDGSDNYYYIGSNLDQKNVLIDASGAPGNNSSYGGHNSLTQLNDTTYVMAYKGWDHDGYIVSFKVNWRGEITVLKQFEHDIAFGEYNSLVTVDGNTVALAYKSYDAGYIKTFTIPPDGSDIKEIKKVKLTETESNSGKYFSFVKLNETIYTLAYQGKSADGFISTIKISLDGETVEEKKTVEHDEVQNSHNSLIQIRPNTVMLACSGVSDDGYIKTFTISSDGSSITPVISLEHNRTKALYNNLIQIDSDTYLLTYNQENNYGVYRTFTSKWLASEVKPEISTLDLHDDNAKIDVTFNEPVYTATGATTALVAGDFKFSITGGTAKLASATPSSISKSSNTYTLGLSLTGTPNGGEVLTVTPAAADAIYDEDDNAASVDHLRNSVNLHDKTLPTITSVKNKQNEYIEVEFSDPVFSQKNNYSRLNTSSFSLTIAEGTATLSSATPSTIIGYGGMSRNEALGNKFKVKIQDKLTGIPNGEEKITVSPASASAIYDMYGNAVSTTQASNVAPLSQSKILNLGQLEYNDDVGKMATVVHVSGKTYAVAYEGPGNDGWITTFSASDDGKTINKIQSYEFDKQEGRWPSFMKISPNIFLLAYASYSKDGYIMTLRISNDGTSIAEITGREHDTSEGDWNSLVRVDWNTYLLAYSGSSGDGYLKTFDIPLDGSKIEEVKNWEYDNSYGEHASLVELSPNYYAVASRGYDNAKRYNIGYHASIKTFNVSNDGKTITAIEWLKHESNSNAGQYNSLVQLDEDSYALAFYWYGSPWLGYLKTFTIQPDGTGIKEESVQLIHSADARNGSSGAFNSTLKMDSDHLLVQSRDRHNDGWVVSYKISDGGKTLTEDWKYEFENNNMDWSWERSLFQIDKDTYGIAYSDYGSDGWIKSLDMVTEEKTKPKFLYTKLSEDNTHMIVQMNEQTFKASSGIGDVEKTDFELSISGGAATLSNPNPTSITKERDRYLLEIGYNGLTDGNEVLTIKPAANSIFDGHGNVAEATQSNNTHKLAEKTPPKFTATTLSDDNLTLKVTFSEPVFKQKGGSGNLEKEDFTLSLAGGTATLQNSVPITISKDNNVYTLTIAYSGAANGTETLTINPVANSIYDAAGNIASTVQSSNQLALNEVRILEVEEKEFDIADGIHPKVIKVDDNTFALAYSGPSSDGFIRTVDIPKDGSSVSLKDYDEHDIYHGNQNSFVKVYDDMFALAYRNRYGHGIIKTFTINSSGTISKTNEKKHTDIFFSNDSFIHLNGTTYLLAFRGSGDDGFISAFKITNDGATIELLEEHEHDTGFGDTHRIQKMSDSTFVVMYKDQSVSALKTFHITADGKTITELKKEVLYDSALLGPAIAMVDENTYLFAGGAKDGDGYLYTYDIPADGSSITKVAEIEFDDEYSNYHDLYNAGSNSFLLSHQGTNNGYGYLKMFTVPANGSNITEIYNTKFNNTVTGQTSLEKLDADTYVLAYQGSGNDGYISTFTVKAGDTVLPVISFVTVSDDNSKVLATFNEKVFNTAGASGALQTSDFALTITGGAATLGESAPDNISVSGKVYTLEFTLTGTADGAEVLKVSPVKDAIFDGGGNAAVENQTNAVKNLNDKTGPAITKTLLSADNKSIKVTFNENAYSTGSGTGNLTKEDFILSISEGVAKLASPTPTILSFSKKEYTLGFSLTGSPNGDEVLKVSPASKAIYDILGNASSTVQKNNSTSLKDIVAPMIDSVMIADNNDILQIFFNESVFSKNDGTGDLDSADFIFSLTGGNATLAKNYPTSISGSGTKTLSLGVSLTGKADGSEILKVKPAEGAIFDKPGNLTLSSQKNNTIALTDKVVPYYKSSSIDPSNKSVTVTFNEKVFTKSDATGILDSTDFNLTLSGGTAKLSKGYPDSVKTIGNIHTLSLSLTGIPDGSEQLTFAPKENAIYDSTGNKASTTQNFSKLTLNDKAPPIIKSLSLAADNSKLSVDFSEKVYSKSDASGDLETSDFVFSVSGDAVVLTSPFPVSISKDKNTYSLGLSYKGDPTGKEVLTVLVVDNAVFDAAGNAAKMQQDTNSVKMKDQNAPFISELRLALNNKTLDVTLNEPAFSSSDGTGSLDSLSFELSITGGTSKLSSPYPSSLKITDSTYLYTLGLPLSGVADGMEDLVVGFKENGVYDASGSVAAATQVKNTVRLFDLSAPTIVESKLNSDNQKVIVSFSVPVFSTAKASGALESDDFKLTLTGGFATLKNSSPSSIEASGDGKEYQLGIDLVGVPNGNEVLTISPVDNNIFDDSANPANKTQANNSMNLFDKQPPIITGVTLSATNDTVNVTLNETTYSTSDTTGALEGNDFTLSILGGNATLTNSIPPSVSVSGNTYALPFTISGTANGNEELMVLPAANSIFDGAGNPASLTQKNNTIYINDTEPPAAPTGLVAVPGNTKASISWKENSEKDVVKYYIYGGTSSGATQKFDSTNFGVNTKLITGLTNGEIYYYQITAFDKTGFESEKSAEIDVTPTTTSAYDVKADGTGDFTTIQDAIDAAISGDSVYIYAGTYDSIRVDGKSIQVIAGDGHATSIIDPKGKTTAVILSGYPNQTSISGFTIKGGVGDQNADGLGGGIRIEAGVQGKIQNCIITGNQDGAIYFGDSSKTDVSNVLVYGNDKSFIAKSGIANLINCTFVGETENSAMNTGASLNFINTIFMDEIAAEDTVTNISLWANNSLFQYGEDSFNSNLIKNYNWGSSMISGDPLFLDTLDADYHLMKKSPAIGVGAASIDVNNITFIAPTKDLDGNKRANPGGSPPDLGIYESPYSNSSPKANKIADGLSDSLELDFTTSTTSLSAHWKPFASSSSIYYEFAIGKNELNDIVDWTIMGSDTSKTVNFAEGTLTNSTTYYFSVRGKNDQGESATITSDGIMVDNEDPVIESVTETKTDMDWFGPNMDGVIYVNATDNGGIAKYEFSIGTVKGSDDVVEWSVSDSNAIHFDVEDLSEKTTYYSNARVTDFVGLTAAASSDSFRMDITPPTTGFLTIGDGLYQSDSANVKFTWGGFIDDQSGIGDFKYSLGTEAGADDVIARQPVGLNVADFASISLTFGGLSLMRNTTYYGTIYSIDKVGNESFAISDGLTIDRDGPTTGTIADGMGEDVDHLNDTTKASANWTGFYDFNGINNYELSLNTTTDSGTVVIVADWTDVGKDSSFTFTGLNLITGKKYYFSVKGSDGLGNKSNIAVSDGFVIDLNGPEVANLSPSSSKLVSVLDSLHVVVTLNEEISKTNIEYASAQADILNIDPTFTVDKNIITISFKPPFTSGDQVKIMIQNTDLAGNVSPTLEYIYNIAYLGDFDFEEGINWKDLNIFVEAWNKNDFSKELGPVNGIPPYLRPSLDKKFNTRDAMAFVRMWNWDKAQKSGKLIAKVLPTEGSALAADFEADHMLIHPPKGTKAMELILNYPVMDMSMGMPIKESVTEQAITLSKVDTVSGQILLNTAYFVKNDLPIRIDLNHLQRDNAVPVDISYQFIGNNNEIISSGNEVLDIKPVPKEFALHNNYPNPFNPVTTINYDLAREGNVSLVVYDVMGREVIRLNDSFMPAGYHTIRWNARNQYGMEVSAGVYFYHIQAGEFVKTQKMILLK